MLIHTKRQVFKILVFLQQALFHHVCYRSWCFIFTEVEMSEEYECSYDILKLIKSFVWFISISTFSPLPFILQWSALWIL